MRAFGLMYLQTERNPRHEQLMTAMQKIAVDHRR
jgi:hypothetical protein